MGGDMRFKGLVGAMDAAAALDALAHEVASGKVRLAPFGDADAPLVLGDAVRLSLKATGGKGKARVAVKLKAAGNGKSASNGRKTLPPLVLGEAAPGPAPEAPDKAPAFSIKAKGGTTSLNAAALLHGLAVGLAAGRLELRGDEDEIVLAPGPVLKLSLKGKASALECKISWKPRMKGEAAPLPPLFTDLGQPGKHEEQTAEAARQASAIKLDKPEAIGRGSDTRRAPVEATAKIAVESAEKVATPRAPEVLKEKIPAAPAAGSPEKELAKASAPASSPAAPAAKSSVAKEPETAAPEVHRPAGTEKTSTPAATAAAAPAATKEPAASPNGKSAKPAVTKAAPAKASGAGTPAKPKPRTKSPGIFKEKPSSAKSAKSSKASKSRAPKASATGKEGEKAVPLPPEAGRPDPDAVANIVAATAEMALPAAKVPPKKAAGGAGKGAAKPARPAPAKSPQNPAPKK